MVMDDDLGNSSSSSSSNASFIIRSMEQKSLLITGATGFLAKVFMEKVLRVQPQVKRIYLLLRAEDNTSATKRFQQEVIGKDVFNVLREIHGSKGFDNFISSKVVCLAGDISLENLGITYSSEVEQEILLKEIDFIVNAAASCNFEDRYDVALSINTLGVKHVFEFAKKCPNLESFQHVSTAYVTREKEGRILEKLPLREGDMFSEISLAKRDIQMELKIVEERLKQLLEEEATDKTTTTSMKALGLQRARFHGWVNTYVFTKAMGEFLLAQLKKENSSVPLVILRPTFITSTYKQPFPGWSIGFNGIDTMVEAYGKGVLTHAVAADAESIMDVIPVDMVVNAMMVALAAAAAAAAAAAHQDGIIIYQVGSSIRNPVKINDYGSWAFDYYSMNPYLDLNGKPIRIPKWTPLTSMAKYSEFVTKHYKLPLEALQVGNNLSLNDSFKDLYNKLNKQYISMTRIVRIFGAFGFFKGRFDNSNSDKLRATTIKQEELKEFEFDTKGIDWEDYYKNVHFPACTRYTISTKSRLQSTSSRL